MPIVIATSPAQNDHDNEDFAAATAHAAVLLDGAGLSGAPSKCTHGVAWYTRHLGGALLANASDGSMCLRTALATAIIETADAHRDTCDLDDAGTPCATVVLTRIHGDQLQYLVLSDSVLVIEPTTGDPAIISDQREAAIGRRYRAAMDAARNDTAEHRDALRAFVVALRTHRNQPGGFWVAAADPAAAAEALVGGQHLAKVAAVTLLSDGASRLVDRFHLMDWQSTLAVLRDHGPHELLRLVRQAESTDPHGKRWPRGKSHDDATIIRWTNLTDARPGASLTRRIVQ